MPSENCPLSLIIPAYNAAREIQRCLRSVRAQTLDGMEILCVDDGSTDRTAEIIREQKDRRITLLRCKHAGVSHARNVGIAAARGEYIQFADADDALEPDCSERAYAAARERDSDCLFFGTKLISDSPPPQWMTECTSTEDRFFSKFTPEVLFDVRGTRPFVWNQIVKRSLLLDNHILFDTSLVLGEDQAFQFAYLPYAKRIRLIKAPLYDHYVRDTSTTFSIYKDAERKLTLHADLVESILKTAERHGVRFRCRVCFWAVDFLYDDVLRSRGSAIKKKISEVFGGYRRLLSLLPLDSQRKAVEIGAMKKIADDPFSALSRKLLFRA